MPVTRNPADLDRVVDYEVAEVLASSPAVLIEGPRGCGKTWTGQRFANSEVFLDRSEALCLAAEVDPDSILEGAEPGCSTSGSSFEVYGIRCDTLATGEAGSGTFFLPGRRIHPTTSPSIPEQAESPGYGCGRCHPLSAWHPLLSADTAAFIAEAEQELRSTASFGRSGF